MRTTALVLIFALSLCCFGCAQQAPALEAEAEAAPAATPSPIPTTAPSVEPEPEPFDADAAASVFEELWRRTAEFALGLAVRFPEEFFTGEELWSVYGTTEEERAWLPEMERSVALCIEESSRYAAGLFDAQYADSGARVMVVIEAFPSWQYVYSLTRGCGSPDAACELICSAMELRAETDGSDGAALTITISPIPHEEAWNLPGGDVAAQRGRKFTYCYCNTVFGEDAEIVEYVQPPADGSLAEGIVWPLASHTRLRKTWFADRDDGTRRHTGTDIWADADTEVYSCTDGIVTYNGYGDGTGHAVVVTDEYGYEFHYYHFIRPSDFIEEGQSVRAGDLIGHVGNTGNSSLDHLHLTIAAPEGYYVNPYPYLEAVEPEKYPEEGETAE